MSNYRHFIRAAIAELEREIAKESECGARWNELVKKCNILLSILNGNDSGDSLRELVRKLLDEANEILDYGEELRLDDLSQVAAIFQEAADYLQRVVENGLEGSAESSAAEREVAVMAETEEVF